MLPSTITEFTKSRGVLADAVDPESGVKTVFGKLLEFAKGKKGAQKTGHQYISRKQGSDGHWIYEYGDKSKKEKMEMKSHVTYDVHSKKFSHSLTSKEHSSKHDTDQAPTEQEVAKHIRTHVEEHKKGESKRKETADQKKKDEVRRILQEFKDSPHITSDTYGKMVNSSGDEIDPPDIGDTIEYEGAYYTKVPAGKSLSDYISSAKPDEHSVEAKLKDGSKIVRMWWD